MRFPSKERLPLVDEWKASKSEACYADWIMDRYDDMTRTRASEKRKRALKNVLRRVIR